MRAIVIGAGILGTSIARELVERGGKVVHIDGGELGGGTTGTTYAWINSHKKTPESYHRLNMKGAAYWREYIARVVPEAFAASGHLETAVDSAHKESLRQRIERLMSLDYPVEVISPDQAQQASPVTVPDGAASAWFPEEGYAFPVGLCRAWAETLTARNTYTRLLEYARAVSPDGTEVTLADGSRVHADRTLIAAGNGSPALVETAGGNLPMVDQSAGGAAFGFLAYAEVRNHGVTSLVTTDHMGLRPLDDHHLLLQALDLDTDADPSTTPPVSVRAAFEKRLGALLPGRTVSVDEVRVGHRVIPADGLTVAGPLEGRANGGVWLAVTHSGIVLGPWLATALVDEILGGEPHPILEDFRPDRFRTTTTFGEYKAPREPGDQ